MKEAHYKALAHYYAAVAHDWLASACSEWNSQRILSAHMTPSPPSPAGDGQVIAEEVRTELRFLYAVDSEEAQEAITTNHHHYHIGLGEH